MMGKLAAELITFEDDFLKLSSPDFERVEHTLLPKSMDPTAGSRIFRWLGELRSTWIRLRAQPLRTHHIFWLGNHTPGANWDTVEQLLFRAAENEGANICNPRFTRSPLRQGCCRQAPRAQAWQGERQQPEHRRARAGGGGSGGRGNPRRAGGRQPLGLSVVAPL